MPAKKTKKRSSKETKEKPGEPQAALRKHLLALLGEAQAHVTFDQALEGLSPEHYGAKPGGLDLTPWRLLEHLRIAQWDILEFCREPDYESPKWPEGYWPASDGPSSPEEWKRSVAQFRRDLRAMQALVADPETDLFAKIPWGSGQTILREAMLVADHNAYHIGQIVTVRKLLGDWKG